MLTAIRLTCLFVGCPWGLVFLMKALRGQPLPARLIFTVGLSIAGFLATYL